MICLHCEKETENPKFCSRSCSAIYNNKNPNRRRNTGKSPCKVCGELKSGRSKFCPKCKPLPVSDKTKGELVKGNANSYGYPQIREVARRMYFNAYPEKKCEECEYDIHIEVHHKVGIEQFPDDALIAEINSLDNLVGLCPNHHWEMDNNLI